MTSFSSVDTAGVGTFVGQQWSIIKKVKLAFVILMMYFSIKIPSNEQKEIRMPATRLTIARLAGVSIATVDRVLRNDPAVRPETAERVQAALENHRRGRAGRGRPAKVTSLRVAFVLPQIPFQFLD